MVKNFFMLKIENLHVSIDDKEILKGLSLDVKPGEIHAIMGPNGSERVLFHLSSQEVKTMKLLKEIFFIMMKILRIFQQKKEQIREFLCHFSILLKYQELP